MDQTGTGNSLKRKVHILIICAVGIIAVSYGVAKDDNVVFVIGIALVIAGYLLIRRRIKKHIRERS
jgi:LPXTG-motif cell wall-anchored protein